MHRVRRIVTVERQESSSRLSDSMSEGAVLLQALEAGGMLSEIGRRLKIYRQGGYQGIDAVVLFVLYFGARVAVGLKEFIGSGSRQRRELGALGGRRFVPTQASISRLLSAVEEKDCEAFGPWLLGEASGAMEVLNHPASLARDGLGQGWHVFDLDPTSTVLRQRALPEAEDLPAGCRRSAEAKPGYLGRKRGEVKFSRTVLQHAGSGLWLGMWTGAAGGDWRRFSAAAIEVVRRTCDRLGHDTRRALLRMDGAGGNVPFITSCQEAGVCYLTRWNRYQLLDEAQIREHLNQADWYPVEDSLSGPSRQAAELGWLSLPGSPETLREDGSPYTPVRSRLVVSRYRSETDRGVGRMIAGWKYELFATDVEPEAWSAPEVVTAYFGRTGLENRFGQEDRELGLDRIFSYHLPGQHLANLLGLFVWNLRVVRGLALAMPPAELPPQVLREGKPVTGGVELPRVEALRRSEETGDPAQSPPTNNDVTGAHATWALEKGEEPVRSTDSRRCEPETGNTWNETSPIKVTSTEPGQKPPPAEQTQPDIQPEPTLIRSEAAQQLQEILGTLNWPRLLEQAPGWTWNENQNGLHCPAQHAIPLRSVRLLRSGATGQLRFVAPLPACRHCPLRSGCTPSIDPGFHKEMALTVSGSTSRVLHTLLARLHGHDPHIIRRKSPDPEKLARTGTPEPILLEQWIRPKAPSDGPHLSPVAAPLLPAHPRQRFSRAARDVEVHVHLGPVPSLKEPPITLASNTAERQHRRLTWKERQTYNRLLADTQVRIRFVAKHNAGPDTIRVLSFAEILVNAA